MELSETIIKGEVKKGYKKTEVGVIPEDWSYDEIGRKIELLTGFPFPSSLYAKDGVRLLKGANIKRGVTDWSEEITNYWDNNLQNYRQYELHAGDLVIAMDGSLVGRSYALLNRNDLPALLLQRVARIRSEKIIVEYLKHFIGSAWFVNYADAVKTVTAIPHISSKDIRSFRIPLPPTFAEQRAIATALSDVDQLIAALGRLIAKKKAIKLGAMQELLTGRKRLEGFSGEWAEKTLGELGEFKNGINKSKSEFGFGSPFINLMDVFGIPTVGANVNFGLVNSSLTEQATYDLRKGDVLFVRSSVKPTGVGLTTLVTQDLRDTVYSGFLIRFRDKGELDTLFKKYCFHTRHFRNHLIANSTVSANTNINQVALKGLSLKYPKSRQEQNAIAQILSDMDTEIAAIEQKLDKYQAIKQGMMQELLTGKTRLV